MTSISRKLSPLLSAALLSLGLAAPLAAQDTELSAGTPVEANEGVGQPYTLETHGDWDIRCLKAPEGQPEPCSLYQLLKDETGNDVAEVSLFHLGQGDVEAAMTITTPLETNLTQMLTFFVDEQNGRRYPFQFCTQAGCFVRAGLPAAEIEQFKKGAAGQVLIAPVGAKQPLKLTMSLGGFTAAYTKVTELNKASIAAEAAASSE